MASWDSGMADERLLLTTDAVGGVWQYSLELARDYAARGLAVDLAVLGPVVMTDRLSEAAEIPGVELVVTDLPLSWMTPDPASLRDAADALAALARQRRATLVHLNCAGLACADHWDMPLVITLHSCMATWWRAVKGQEPLPYDFSWRTEMMAEALARAAAIIVPSGSFAVAAREVYREGSPPAVVYNGRSEATTEGLAAERSDTVFTCGRLWDEAKNAAVLDAAAGRTRAPILAAGATRNPSGETIELRHLQLLGELTSGAVRRQLDESGIFVSAALYEPFGLGTLEAAQRGCALVLSDIPTFRELWSGAALLVDPRDPQAFAEEVERLLGAPVARAEWGRRARQRAEAFTATKMAARTLAVYTQASRHPVYARAAS